MPINGMMVRPYLFLHTHSFLSTQKRRAEVEGGREGRQEGRVGERGEEKENPNLITLKPSMQLLGEDH